MFATFIIGVLLGGYLGWRAHSRIVRSIFGGRK